MRIPSCWGPRRRDQWHAVRGGAAGSSFLLIGLIGKCLWASNSHHHMSSSSIDGDQMRNHGRHKCCLPRRGFLKPANTSCSRQTDDEKLEGSGCSIAYECCSLGTRRISAGGG